MDNKRIRNQKTKTVFFSTISDEDMELFEYANTLNFTKVVKDFLLQKKKDDEMEQMEDNVIFEVAKYDTKLDYKTLDKTFYVAERNFFLNLHSARQFLENKKWGLKENQFYLVERVIVENHISMEDYIEMMDNGTLDVYIKEIKLQSNTLITCHYEDLK